MNCTWLRGSLRSPGPNAGYAGRRRLRQLEERAEALLILVVVLLDDDRAVGELRLKVIADWARRRSRTR